MARDADRAPCGMVGTPLSTYLIPPGGALALEVPRALKIEFEGHKGRNPCCRQAVASEPDLVEGVGKLANLASDRGPSAPKVVSLSDARSGSWWHSTGTVGAPRGRRRVVPPAVSRFEGTGAGPFGAAGRVETNGIGYSFPFLRRIPDPLGGQIRRGLSVLFASRGSSPRPSGRRSEGN